jgi:hypothetical protein
LTTQLPFICYKSFILGFTVGPKKTQGTRAEHVYGIAQSKESKRRTEDVQRRAETHKRRGKTRHGDEGHSKQIVSSFFYQTSRRTINIHLLPLFFLLPAFFRIICNRNSGFASSSNSKHGTGRHGPSIQSGLTKLSHFCLRPDSKAVAQGLGRHI